MIEVYKTNITDFIQASIIADRIHSVFCEYLVNFDLDDCDHIMRVVSPANDAIDSYHIVQLVEKFGWHAQILEDEVLPESPLLTASPDLSRFYN